MRVVRGLLPRPSTALEPLERDLRTRFPELELVFSRDADGVWTCRIEPDAEHSWGWGGTAWWLSDTGDLADGGDGEDLLLGVAEFLCDNMWPDELTDPWPRCPAHQDHALNPGGSNGGPAWTCGYDRTVTVAIGDLGRA